MKRLIVLIAFLIVTPVPAQESVVLDNPAAVDPGATTFRPFMIHIELLPGPRIIVGLQEWSAGFVDGGKNITCTWTGTEAHSLIVALNKANLSSNSLEKRIMTQAQASGCLGAGTITGAPE